MHNSSIREKKVVSINQYSISAGPDKIYIRHDKSNRIIYINRETFDISEVSDYNGYLNRKNYNEFQVDSIIGILTFNSNNKYLLFLLVLKNQQIFYLQIT